MNASRPRCGSARRPRARPAGGFALVIVLWVLAALTVVAVSIAATVQSNSQSVKLLRERLRAERAFLTTGSRLKVIGATSIALPYSYLSGRGQVFLDGRVSRVSADETLVLQDGRGLLSLEQPAGAAWQRFLVHCGATTDEAQRLQDTLADYVDADSLRRLHGAERDDYRETPLPPPRNAGLLSREELWRVLGWPEFRGRWEAAGCNDDVITGEADEFNPNTAPLEVLLAHGWDELQARALIDARRAGLPLQSGGLLDLGNGPNVMLRGGSLVGDRIRVRHWMAPLEWALQYDLQFTPSEPGGPWRMLEVRVVKSAPQRPQRSGASDFPPLDFVASQQDSARLNAVPTSPIGR